MSQPIHTQINLKTQIHPNYTYKKKKKKNNFKSTLKPPNKERSSNWGERIQNHKNMNLTTQIRSERRESNEIGFC